MNLSDATERAAVDLFLRNLYFTFPTRDVVGIPGNVIGFPEPHQKEEDSALLMHELEHINCLMFPIGAFFSALAFRAHELRNAMATQFTKLRHDHLASLAEDHELPDAMGVVLSASQTSEFAKLVLTTAELMAPLLEGLAMLSEMELKQRDSTWSWMLAVGIEYNYHEHWLALTDLNRHKLLEQDDIRRDFVEGLFNALETQLKLARERRLQGELLDRIFFPRTNDERPLVGIPYFYGYLYLNRLYQEWKRRLPELQFERFASLASKLLCSVIPLTIVPIYSIRDHEGEAMSPKLPMIFGELLKDFLALTAAQIRQLEQDRGSLNTWSLVDRQFRPAGLGADNQSGEMNYNRVVANLVISLFDLRDTKDPKLNETIDFIQIVERSKFLVRTAVRDVFVIGIDASAGVAILADPNRLTRKKNENQLLMNGGGGTFFKFQDATVLEKFINIAEGAKSPLARVKLGEAPYKIKGDGRVFPAQLQTFCYFWPFGVPQDDPDGTFLTSRPVSIVRVLACHSEPDSTTVSFVDGPEVRDLPALLEFRDLMNREMRSNFARALDPDFPDARFVLGEIESLFSDSLTTEVAGHMRQQYAGGQFPALQDTCRGVYRSLIFPVIDANSKLSTERLNALAKHLGRNDMTTLRRWLRKGAALQPGKSYKLGIDGRNQEEEKLSLDRIRAGALVTLGIPFVQFSDNPPRIVLDLLLPDGSDANHAEEPLIA